MKTATVRQEKIIKVNAHNSQNTKV